MTKLFWRVFVAITLVAAGCASSQSDRAVDPSSVKIIQTSRKGCKKVGDLALTSSSTKQLTRTVRRKAAALGATHVQLTVMEAGSVSKKIRAFGVILICPLSVTAADPSVDVDSDLSSGKMDEGIYNEVNENEDYKIDESSEEEKEDEGDMPYPYKPKEDDGPLP